MGCWPSVATYTTGLRADRRPPKTDMGAGLRGADDPVIRRLRPPSVTACRCGPRPTRSVGASRMPPALQPRRPGQSAVSHGRCHRQDRKLVFAQKDASGSRGPSARASADPIVRRGGIPIEPYRNDRNVAIAIVRCMPAREEKESSRWRTPRDRVPSKAITPGIAVALLRLGDCDSGRNRPQR